MMTLIRACALAVALPIAFGAAACPGCDPPPVTPPDAAVGGIRVDVDGGEATLTLVGMSAAVRALQVDVDVAGGVARGFVALAGHDVAEAGLDDNGAARFTAVLSDTRRLPIGAGAVARIVVDAGASVSLTNAFVVDDAGQKRALRLVVP
jgi:hypothetical protein